MNEELLSYKINVNFDNKVICDIGANEGEMVNFFLRNSKDTKIIGIEPHMSNINKLNSLFSDEDGVEIIHGAINTYSGICKIGHEQQQRVNGLKQGHVMNNGKTDLQNRSWGEVVDVPCWELSEICKEVDIIKMDIEGFEHKVIYGSLHKLDKLETILIEIHSWEDLDIHGWTNRTYIRENDSLNKMLLYFIENGFTKMIPAKNRNGRITKVDGNTTWNDIPISSYVHDGKRVYYKVVNLIIQK